MASQTIRLGVIGTRNIGKSHIRCAADIDGAEILAIAEPDDELRTATAEEFDVPHAHASADELLDQDDVDGVILAVPNHLHEPMTAAAMQAGKHVLVEKPISRTADEARRMIALRDRHEKVLMVGMNQRFLPTHQAIRRAIDAGALGPLQTARTWWLTRRPHPGLWGRGDWFLSADNAGGGPMLDLGVHRLDLALWLLGFPDVASVTGTASYGIGRHEANRRGKTYEIEDAAAGLVRFREGGSLYVEASYFQNTPSEGQDTILCGTHGSVQTKAEPPVLAHGPEDTRPVDLPDVSGASRSCVEHFVRVLRGDELLSPTAEQARTSMQIIEAIYHSAHTGETVTFPA